jgi:hypothetical protein
VLLEIGHISALALSEDGSIAAGGGASGRVRLLRTDGTGSPGDIGDGGSEVFSIAFSQDDRLLAVGYASGNVWLGDVNRSEVPVRFSVGKSPVNALEFAQSAGDQLWVATDGHIEVWHPRFNHPPLLSLRSPREGSTDEREPVLAILAIDDWALHSISATLNGREILSRSYEHKPGVDGPGHSRDTVEIRQSGLISLREGGNTISVKAVDCDGDDTRIESVFVRYVPQPKPAPDTHRKPVDTGISTALDTVVNNLEQRYFDAEFEEVVTGLARTIPELEKGNPDSHKNALLVKSYVLLGCASLGLGNEEEARRALSRALEMEPELEVEPDLDSPKVREILSDLRSGQGNATD